MVSHAASTGSDEERMDLLVLASDAERARNVLSHGIPRLAASNSTSIGAAAFPGDFSTSAISSQAGIRRPLPIPATPTDPVPATSSADSFFLRSLCVTLIVVVLMVVVALFLG
jgi:hypothetical protein